MTDPTQRPPVADTPKLILQLLHAQPNLTMHGLHEGLHALGWRSTPGMLLAHLRPLIAAGQVRVLQIDGVQAFKLGTDLDGATTPPDEGSMAADAGQFAARWNAMSPEKREERFTHWRALDDLAHACMVQDHRGALAHAQRLEEWTNALAARMPDRYDGDEDQRALIDRWVTDLTRMREYDDATVRALIRGTVYDGGHGMLSPEQLSDMVDELVAVALTRRPELPRSKDCSCTPHSQDAGGGYTEYLLEYDPACPVHSTHVYDPRRQEWIDPSDTTFVVDTINALGMTERSARLGAVEDHLRGMIDSLDEHVTIENVAEQLQIAWRLAKGQTDA